MTYIPVQNGGVVQPFGTALVVVADPEVERLKVKLNVLILWILEQGFEIPENLLED